LRFANDATSTASANVLELSGIETAARSTQALSILSNRLNTLSTIRGDFGALSSRLETVNAVLSVTKENVSAAESSIRDVDVAAEAALLTRGQILQQAGTAVLAQANAQPRIALGLLKNF